MRRVRKGRRRRGGIRHRSAEGWKTSSTEINDTDDIVCAGGVVWRESSRSEREHSAKDQPEDADLPERTIVWPFCVSTRVTIRVRATRRKYHCQHRGQH